MADFYDDNSDLRFYVERLIGWRQIEQVGAAAGGAPSARTDRLSAFKARCSAVGQLAAGVAPRARSLEREARSFEVGALTLPPTLSAVFDEIAALKLHGMCLPNELGGSDAPVVLYFATLELIARADAGVAAHYSFHAGIATALWTFVQLGGEEHGRQAPTPFEEAIRSIAAGEAWGSLDLVEPDGDDALLTLSSSAARDEVGGWRITGTKARVTSGHGRWHLVLARAEADAEGPSLFLVDAAAAPGAVQVVEVDDKLGQRAAPTVTVRFERAPGLLIGQRGQGRRRVLRMLNLARIAAGMQGLGVSEAALRLARSYAEERAAQGRDVERRELMAELIDAMRTDVEGLRALAYAAAVHEERAMRLTLQLRVSPPDDREEREYLGRELHRHSQEARRLTPLLKVAAADRAVKNARRCVQVHGDGGHTSGFGAERLLRDAMVLPQYEGTHELLCRLVAREGVLGVLRRPQAALMQAASARWSSVRGSPLERRVARLQTLGFACQQHLVTRLAGRRFSELRSLPWDSLSAALTEWQPEQGLAPVLVHAVSLTRLWAEVAIAEVLLEQVALHPDRTEVLERHLERAEPRVRYLHDRITSTGDRLVGALEEG